MVSRRSVSAALFLGIAFSTAAQIGRAENSATLEVRGTVEPRILTKVEPIGPQRFRFTYSTNSTAPLLIEAHQLDPFARFPASSTNSLVLKRTLDPVGDGATTELTAQSVLDLKGKGLVITITAQ